MNEWSARGLDEVYAAIFIVPHIVGGVPTDRGSWFGMVNLADRPIYAAIGVSVAGEKDVLGLWAGAGEEGAKFWTSVLTDIKNRGVRDTFFLVCDGLEGLPEVLANVWPPTTVQTGIIHLIRTTFDAGIEEGLGALTQCEADPHRLRTPTRPGLPFEELDEKRGRPHGLIPPAPGTHGRNPSRSFDDEIRTVICSANAIESLNALPARSASPRVFPDRANRAEMPVPCHQIPRPDRHGTKPMDDGRWKPALDAFAFPFADRWPAAETY